MWILVICVILLLLICIFGSFLRNQYLTRKCQRNKLLHALKLKPFYELLEFIDWILQYFFRIHLFQIPKKALIGGFQKTLNNPILGNHQHLLLEGFVRYIEELDQIPMNFLNRIIVRSELQCIIKTRENVINCLKMYPEILSLTIVKPFIITGLPRTGSTMLYNLLNVDQSSFETAKIWQMSHLVENPTPSTSKIRRQKAFEAYMKEIHKVSDEYLPLLYSSHPPSSETFENEGPEEDLLVLLHCFPMITCPYHRWMINDEAAKGYYEYHYKYFAMLELDNINKNNFTWLWKCPTHTLFLNSLIETYPDARFIITHRHPFEVIPSLAKFYTTILRIKRMPATVSLKEVGKIAFDICKTMINRMETNGFFNKNNNNVNLLHIHYSDLINNPINSIRRIYNHYDLSPITPQLKEIFHVQSTTNPQDKYGRMTYDLDEFELTENQIQTEFAKYINWLDTIKIF